jgi:hypothetical protein
MKELSSEKSLGATEQDVAVGLHKVKGVCTLGRSFEMCACI